jgi:hypothetical protein
MFVTNVKYNDALEVAEKGFGMLRESQHERRILNDIKTLPFVLSSVEGLPQSFPTA